MFQYLVAIHIYIAYDIYSTYIDTYIYIYAIYIAIYMYCSIYVYIEHNNYT